MNLIGRAEEVIKHLKSVVHILRNGGFENVGLVVGEPAVDFTLKDVQEKTVSLADLLSEKPVVMVFGSFT